MKITQQAISVLHLFTTFGNILGTLPRGAHRLSRLNLTTMKKIRYIDDPEFNNRNNVKSWLVILIGAVVILITATSEDIEFGSWSNLYFVVNCLAILTTAAGIASFVAKPWQGLSVVPSIIGALLGAGFIFLLHFSDQVIVPDEALIQNDSLVVEETADNALIEEPSATIQQPARPIQQTKEATQEKPQEIQQISANPIAEQQAEPTTTERAQEPPRELSSSVYDVVEKMPSFPGGNGAMMQFIQSNVNYPAAARENGIQGRVQIGFIVEHDGSISDVRVVRSVDPALDMEAVRVVKRMPRWEPGKQNGQPVRVKYTVPVLFRL